MKLKIADRVRGESADKPPPVIGVAGRAGATGPAGAVLLSALNALRDLGRIRLAGLWEPEEVNRGSAGSAGDSLRLPPENRFDDLEGLLRREGPGPGKGLAALLVTGTFESRNETIRRALERKDHVLAEPPLAGTAAEAESLIDAGSAAGVHLGVLHSARYDALYAEALWAVRERRIGEVLFVRTERPGPDTLDADATTTPLPSGLYEDIYLTRAWASSPLKSVYARTGSLRRNRGGVGFTVLHFQHAGGGDSILGRMNTVGAPSEVCEIHGTGGTIRIHRADRAWFLCKRTDGPDGDPWERNEPGEEKLRGGVTLEALSPETGARACARALDDAFASFARGVPPPVDGREAWLNLRALDAARESARTGEVVRVNIPFPR